MPDPFALHDRQVGRHLLHAGSRMRYMLVVGLTTLAALILLLNARSVASADHGSWWHHNGHMIDYSATQWRAYAHTQSDDFSDFLVARIFVYRNGSQVGAYTAQCGWASEACRDTPTPSVYWSKGGSNYVETYHCGRDDPHTIPGDLPIVPCAGMAPAHGHIYSWSG
jgi:hypothetical protein